MRFIRNGLKAWSAWVWRPGAWLLCLDVGLDRCLPSVELGLGGCWGISLPGLL